jgi:hypothetical protein
MSDAKKGRRGIFVAKPRAMVVVDESRIEVEIDAELERRLENWRNVVIFGSGGSGNYCASWAAAYYAQRNLEELKRTLDGLSVGALEALVGSIKRHEIDQADGWLIERLVMEMPMKDQQLILRLKFVGRRDWPEISKVMRRFNKRSNIAASKIVLRKAITSLQDALAQIKSDARIQSYNLHTWSVPCPEAQAVPLGTPAPTEN